MLFCAAAAVLLRCAALVAGDITNSGGTDGRSLWIGTATTRQERKLFNYMNTIVILITPILMRIIVGAIASNGLPIRLRAAAVHVWGGGSHVLLVCD